MSVYLCLCVLATEGVSRGPWSSSRWEGADMLNVLAWHVLWFVMCTPYLVKGSRGEGEVAVLYLLGCIDAPVLVCEVFVTSSRHFLIHLIILWNGKKDNWIQSYYTVKTLYKSRTHISLRIDWPDPCWETSILKLTILYEMNESEGKEMAAIY